MRSVPRLTIALAVMCAFTLPGVPVAATEIAVESAAASTATPDGTDGVSLAGEDDEVEPVGDDGGLTWGPALAGAALVAVLVLGLRAVKRQREEGRRSKFPPIG